MESIQVHPYLNVCAQCKHGLGKSDDISQLTIGGRQECWQQQTREIQEIKREADSKKPFESVNEFRREKHKDHASPAVQDGPQVTRLYQTSCKIFTCHLNIVLSEEKTVAIKQIGYQNWERTIHGIRREEKNLRCKKVAKYFRNMQSFNLPERRGRQWAWIKPSWAAAQVKKEWGKKNMLDMFSLWTVQRPWLQPDLLRWKPLHLLQTSTEGAVQHALPVWQGMTLIGIAGKKVSPKCQRVGSIHMPVLPPFISGQ